MTTASRDHMTKAEIVGRLGQTPELRYTEDQTPFVRMSIATSERFTDSGGGIRERTDWHNAVAWGPVAQEIASLELAKGESVALSGALRINSYEKDGVKNRVTEINIASVSRNLDNQPSKNDIRLIGVVREDPTVRQFESGAQLTNVSVATRITTIGRDGVSRDREDWHSVPLWGKAAEAAREIKAGDTIAINGALRHETIPGDNGVERKVSAIRCQRFQVLEVAHVQPERSNETGPRPRAQERAPELSGAVANQGLEAPAASPRRRSKRGVDRGV